MSKMCLNIKQPTRLDSTWNSTVYSESKADSVAMLKITIKMKIAESFVDKKRNKWISTDKG